MCQFASFYLTKTSAYWGPTDSHTDIIQHHGLTEDGVRGPNGEKIELIPPSDDPKCSDLSKWVYILDQDIHTEWHLEDPGKTEERARAALARRAADEKWFVCANGQLEVAGYASTLTGGYASTLTGGNRSTLTGGDASTLTGGYASTLTGGNRSTLTGGYESIFIIRWYDHDSGKDRFVSAQVDGATILPGVPYCVSNGVFTRKDQ